MQRIISYFFPKVYSSTTGYSTVQLDRTTFTDIFGPKNGKFSTIKYYVRKIQNPWILGKHEIQYLIVLYFPLFRQKIAVFSTYCITVNFRKKGPTRRCAAAPPEPPNHLENED